MNLLCAIMIGTQCLMFHPPRTKPKVENFKFSRTRSYNAKKNEIAAMGDLGWIKHKSSPPFEPECQAEKIAYLMALKIGPGKNIEWSCTQGQIDDYSKEQIVKKYTPMSRQHMGIDQEVAK